MAQLLDLSTLERDTIKLPDGTDVELVNPNELSIVEDFKVRTMIGEFADVDLEAIDSEEKAAEESTKLHTLARLLTVDAPENLDDFGCAGIVSVWIEKHIVTAAGAGGQQGPPPNRATRRTTAGSSRGSKRSTAATRKSGSRKSRGGR